MQLKQQRHTIDTIFILILLCTFVLSSLLLAYYGSREYKSCVQAMDTNFNERTAAAYIREKLHQNDCYNAVQILDKDGTSVLQLTEEISGSVYHTCIYSYENQIHEILLSDGCEYALSDGQKILENHGLSFSMTQDDLLQVTITDPSDQKQTIYISLHSTNERSRHE